MNKSLRFLAILAILPLFAVGLGFGPVTDADALKASGTEIAKYGSSTGVCGLQLCSEIPGGKAAWLEGQDDPAPVAEEEATEMEATDPEATEMEAIDPEATEMDATEMDATEMEAIDAGSELRLSRANVPATIPMHHGFYDGGDVYYIITDSSDPTHANLITANQNWQVELAPLLKNAPEEALSRTYLFVNGIEGGGIHGYQGEIFTSTPAQADIYSALTSHVHVTWNEDAVPRVLDSEAAVNEAVDAGEVTLIELNVVLNMPQIIWPDGQMLIREDATITDEMAYGGGQITDIDTDEMTVTFVAHRGWGPDGRTIYYIVTDATPSGPAEGMGVTNAPSSSALIANSAAVDLYQFKNGLTGTGPLGFQPGIAVGGPGDENYSPMWRIFLAEWVEPENAQLLETVGDLNAYTQADMIKVEIARPMDSDHIVNCPFIDPFQ